MLMFKKAHCPSMNVRCAILKINVGDKVELRRILSSVRPRVVFAEAAE